MILTYLKTQGARLSRRDRFLLGIMLVLVTGVGILQLGVRPLLAEKERLVRVVSMRQQHLLEMQQLATDYRTLQAEDDRRRRVLQRQPGDITLFGFLDRQAGLAGVKPHIVFMKPSQVNPSDAPYTMSSVEMKLEGIDLQQATRFLELVEKAEAFQKTLSVRRFSLARSGGTNPTLELILQVESLAF